MLSTAIIYFVAAAGESTESPVGPTETKIKQRQARAVQTMIGPAIQS
jgi:hypothetical protein